MTEPFRLKLRDAPASERPSPPAEVRIVNSRDLLCGQRSLLIRHGVDAYRLQVTRGGKLILTK